MDFCYAGIIFVLLAMNDGKRSHADREAKIQHWKVIVVGFGVPVK